jgi:hypothetical protein
MDPFLQRARKTDSSPGPVIVFEPVQIRSGAAWRAFALAKLALMVWGGVSLAGVGAGAVVYARGGTVPILQVSALQAPSRPETELALVKPEPPSAPEPARSGPHLIRVKPAASVKTAPTGVSIPKPLPAETAAVPPAAKPIPVVPADLVQTEEKPLTQARLPQSRPSEPEFTGSIGRSVGEAAPPRRFRRLRDVRLRAPYAPGTRLRMPPPLRETDPAGRHIRQVWSSFPRQAPHREPWSDLPRYR